MEGRLPELVEVPAYYAVAEALTNTAKYAGASAAEVEATAGEGVLQVRVRDDGRGGADLGGGSGLAGLKDRSRRSVAGSPCVARPARAPPCRSPCPSAASPGRHGKAERDARRRDIPPAAR